MIVVFLSLIGAAGGGVGNFTAGMAAKKLPALIVSFAAFTIEIPVWALISLIVPSSPSWSAAMWGTLGGVVGGIGVILMLTALSRGRMSVAAPITGAVAAGAPVIFDLVRGNHQNATASVGLVLLIFAIILISLAESVESSSTTTISVTKEIMLAVVAGLGAGVYYICINQAPKGAGAFTLEIGDVAGVLMLIPIILNLPKTWLHQRDGWKEIFLVTALFPLAPLFFTLAIHHGSLSVAAVVISLSPVFTLLLAATMLKERLRLLQIVGLICCLSGLALVASGTA